MAKIETLEDFYKRKFNWLPDSLQKDLGHFNVFRIEDCVGPKGTPVKYSRKDFYKISLLRGKSVYHYADKSIEVSGSTLLFFNPHVPYTFQPSAEDRSGFFCIFRESFFADSLRRSLHELPMFTISGMPTYSLDKGQDKQAEQIFQKMLKEINSDYKYKYDLLKNYLTELIHFTLKMEPSETLYQHPDANFRITSVFTELLERQFPIESPEQRFTMRSAKDFAEQLAVHVNHLNRAIRVTTGKTTTEHISERLVREAIALLKHTTWNVSEISYSLGFEEPTHFNNFFKKHTRQTPGSFRIV